MMITIVSGLPRSGTSLMMQILAANGYDILTDGKRTADENNINGYYEYEKVKALKSDNLWLSEAEGKAVKIIAQLLPYLPSDFMYEIIYMERNIEEVINSQNKMLARLNKNVKTPEIKAIKDVFQKQNEQIKKNISLKSNVRFLCVSFNELLNCTDEQIISLIQFTNNRLEKEKILKSIEQNLYRERSK